MLAMGNRQWAMATIVALAMAGGLWAQEPQPPQPPQARPEQPFEPGMQGPGGPDRERMERLRAQIEERFGQMVRTELQLNDQQMDRLRAAMRANQDRRRELMRREMDIRRAIRDQMQPGQAANNDSLNRLLDQEGRLRVQRAESDQQLLRDLSFMTPVQRVRFGQMLQRFEQRMREIRDRRPMMQGGPQRPPQQRRPRPGIR